MIKYARGTVWWAKLRTDTLTTEESTHIQYGERPVLVVSNNTANVYSPILTVIPLTTHADNLPMHIKLCTNSNKDSFALIEQIRPIDKTELDNYMGMLSADDMRQVEDALTSQLGLI